MSAVHYRVEFAGPRFVTVERLGDAPRWSLRIDATEGLESLHPRGIVRALGDDLVLLFTEGEHTRTGAAHHHKIHRLTRDGRLLWSLCARPVGDPVLHGGYLLIPAAPVAPRTSGDDPPALQLQLRDPETGALLASFPIQPPSVLRSAYRHAARALGAHLSPAPHGVHVAVTAWFTGPLAPPRGAGAFDVLLALD
ncbi:hypothetical protein [Nannocystis bainbridge]|uniref:Uncharacterized protein n=1 Tax=Nannocystis bainbridge TaxID=2995303 RepID=A0ABT5DXK6_9BACT|nr:hypothetical protein [Nannocystis bainbridge]MDC0718290.1 hypothetical protein [Nannocystis bainbridge]